MQNETIAALATASGLGAIAVIRVSGNEAISSVNHIFKGKNLNNQASHTIHFGTIMEEDTIVDEVLVSVFVAPHSFTKENSIEISCHGSPFIIRKILQLLVKQGVKLAKPGEFTQRAFMNGAFDLAQAEAVADLIASDSEMSHRIAMNQMRGGFSKKLQSLRDELIHFASMVELELDFGEEDVEFADRNQLKSLIYHILDQLKPLIESFKIGNVMKEGIPIAIVGPPNVGKSTLLNAFFNEEKAIVTPIAGTTRDIVEDTLIVKGQKIRFIDTAGIRETSDLVEGIGIERSKAVIKKATIILCLFTKESDKKELDDIIQFIDTESVSDKLILIQNKIDLEGLEFKLPENVIGISASKQLNLELLIHKIIEKIGIDTQTDTIVTNARHYEALTKTEEALQAVIHGIDAKITNDFVAQDIRLALFYLGEITGQVTPDDLLESIFSRFCIGK
ncbi:MAG: tRNA uridine-5-carboxymethylaminomethyl(34) synthesis GTPase MnmE [Bacteroidota bacterium]